MPQGAITCSEDIAPGGWSVASQIWQQWAIVQGLFLQFWPLLQAKQIGLPAPNEQASVVVCFNFPLPPPLACWSPTPPFMRAGVALLPPPLGRRPPGGGGGSLAAAASAARFFSVTLARLRWRAERPSWLVSAVGRLGGWALEEEAAPYKSRKAGAVSALHFAEVISVVK